MAALKKILVPVDGSPPSLSALEHALTLAEEGDAIIDLLHVDGHDTFEVGGVTPIAPRAREEVERMMAESFAQAQAALGSRVAFLTLSGDPVRRIVETASAGAYDLIVMGTHGRIGRLRSLLGSVADAVVRNAPCPVLTVREPGGEYQSFAESRHGKPSLAEQVQHHPG
jgi:nucleotide-binding universal stress UspA family protein